MHTYIHIHNSHTRHKFTHTPVCMCLGPHIHIYVYISIYSNGKLTTTHIYAHTHISNPIYFHTKCPVCHNSCFAQYYISEMKRQMVITHTYTHTHTHTHIYIYIYIWEKWKYIRLYKNVQIWKSSKSSEDGFIFVLNNLPALNTLVYKYENMKPSSENRFKLLNSNLNC